MKTRYKLLFLFIFIILGFSAKSALAANKYWVGGGASTNWDATGNTNWSDTDGGANNASVPATGDNVFFKSSANCVVNVTPPDLNSLDMTGYTGTFSGSSYMVIRAQSGSQVVKFAGTITWTNDIYFNADSGATLTATFNGKGSTFGNVYVNSNSTNTGTVVFADNLTIGATRTLQFNYGTFKMDGASDNSGLSHSMGAFSSSNTNTRTLTLGTSSIALTAAGTTLNIGLVTGLTVSTNTATITLSGAGADASLGSSKNYNGLSLVFSGSGDQNLTANGGTFANITRTGTAAKTDAFNFNGTVTVTGTLNLNGNSATNRIYVTSTVVGSDSVFTITGATVNASNVDFRDITLSVSTNLSAITGKSGDAGGNSGITFTTAATQTWSGTSGGNWSANAWTTRVPLPQDDVAIASAFSSGQTITMDMPRIGKSISWTGTTWSGTAPTWSFTVASSFFGSITLVSGMAISNGALNLTSHGRGSFTLTSAGVNWANAPLVINMVGGTMTLQDAFSSTRSVAVTLGTFDANDFNVTGTDFSFANSASSITNMGSGTWTATSVTNVWSVAGASTAINTESSTIAITNTSATVKTFAGAGKTYYNVIFSGDNITVTGANTFNSMAVNNAGLANGLFLTTGITQTVSAFSSNGYAGNLAKMFSSTAVNATIAKAGGGTVSEDYMNINYITGSTANTWYMGSHSTDGGSNVNLIFSDPRSPSTPAVGLNSRTGGTSWYATGGTWTNRKQIVINPDRLSTTATTTFSNFPMLFSVTDADLKFTGSGGKVASSTGGDILFTASDGTTKLDHEIEKYTSTTGETIAWVRIPTLSSSTVAYIYFGNASATDQQAATSTWDSNYKGVYHLKDGTTLNYNDSTSNAKHGTGGGGSASPTAGAGYVDGAASFNNVTYQFIDLPSSTFGSGSVTVELWTKFTTFTGYWPMFSAYTSDADSMEIFIDNTSRLFGGNYNNRALSSSDLVTGQWYHVVLTAVSGGVTQFYINGVAGGSTGTTNFSTYTVAPRIGRRLSYYYNNLIDEVRVSSGIARSADWIKTTYNNQSDPSLFFSYGALGASTKQNSSGSSMPVMKVRGGVKFR